MSTNSTYIACYAGLSYTVNLSKLDTTGELFQFFYLQGYIKYQYNIFAEVPSREV